MFGQIQERDLNSIFHIIYVTVYNYMYCLQFNSSTYCEYLSCDSATAKAPMAITSLSNDNMPLYTNIYSAFAMKTYSFQCCILFK